MMDAWVFRATWPLRQMLLCRDLSVKTVPRKCLIQLALEH